MSDVAVDTAPDLTPTATDTPTAPTDWRATLPEHFEVDGKDDKGQPVKTKVPFRNNPALKDFRDTASLARSYIDTKALVGQQVKLPGPFAKPEEKRAFWAKMGVPEKPDGYEAAGVRLPPPPGGDDGPGWNQERLAAVAAKFHEAGYTPAQYQVALDVFAEEMAAGAEAQARGLDALKAEWGMSFPTRVERARRVIGKFFPKGTAEKLNQTGWGNDPALIRGIYELSTRFREGEFVEGEGSGAVSGDVLKQQIADIRRDPKHPAMDPTNPGHKAALARLEGLYKAAYGTDER